MLRYRAVQGVMFINGTPEVHHSAILFFILQYGRSVVLKKKVNSKSSMSFTYVLAGSTS